MSHDIDLDDDLKALVADGCGRNRLRCLIKVFVDRSLADDSWINFCGMSLRKLRRSLEALRRCADATEAINRGFVVSFVSTDPSYRWLRNLPMLLRRYAKQLELLTRIHGPKKHPLQHFLKANLVTYVRQTTGKWHDREVSNLISAVLNKPSYDEVSHRMWRRNHRALISIWQAPARRKPTAGANHPAFLQPPPTLA